jgi:cytochrome c-type biogenesis protein
MELTITHGAAFLSGLLAFLSPGLCPILAVWVSYVLLIPSPTEQRPTRPLVLHATALVLGFLGSFVLTGASSTSFGQFLFNTQPVFQRIGGALLILFGLWTMDIVRIFFLTPDRLNDFRGNVWGLPGSLLIGAALSFAWSFSDGPALGSILLMAGTPGTVPDGLMRLCVHAAGLAVPLLVFSYLVGMLALLGQRVPRIAFVLNRLAGSGLAVSGILMLMGYFSKISGWMNQTFEPWINWLMDLGL